MNEVIEGADGGRGSEGGYLRGDPATVRSRRASKPRHKAVALDGTRDSVVPQACIDSDVALAMESYNNTTHEEKKRRVPDA